MDMLVALNCHAFHPVAAVRLCCETVAAGMVRLAQDRPTATARAILFVQSHAGFSQDDLGYIQSLGLQICDNPGQANGERLNAQIEMAIRDGFGAILRVDADDTVTADRFVRQFDLLASRSEDVFGGGLEYCEMGSARRFVVQPPEHPKARDLMLNRFMMHPTFAMRTATLQRTGLRYWSGRLEDKEFLQRAIGMGVRFYNEQAIYGTYAVSPDARNNREIADLELQMTLQFLRQSDNRLLVPVAYVINGLRRVISVPLLRRIRSMVLRDVA